MGLKRIGWGVERGAIFFHHPAIPHHPSHHFQYRVYTDLQCVLSCHTDDLLVEIEGETWKI